MTKQRICANDTARAKTLDDLQYDATMIAGMIDGIVALWDNSESHAKNAMTPVIEQARRMANKLASDLDSVNRNKLEWPQKLRQPVSAPKNSRRYDAPLSFNESC